MCRDDKSVRISEIFGCHHKTFGKTAEGVMFRLYEKPLHFILEIEVVICVVLKEQEDINL